MSKERTYRSTKGTKSFSFYYLISNRRLAVDQQSSEWCLCFCVRINIGTHTTQTSLKNELKWKKNSIYASSDATAILLVNERTTSMRKLTLTHTQKVESFGAVLAFHVPVRRVPTVGWFHFALPPSRLLLFHSTFHHNYCCAALKAHLPQIAVAATATRIAATINTFPVKSRTKDFFNSPFFCRWSMYYICWITFDFRRLVWKRNRNVFC